MKVLTLNFLFLTLFGMGLSAQSTKPVVPQHDTVASLLAMCSDTIAFSPDNQYTIISFFSVFCKPCRNELKALNENNNVWYKEFNAEIIAVSSITEIDYFKRIKKYADKNSFSFPLYIDFKNELTMYLYNKAEAISENHFKLHNDRVDVLKPHLFILDSKGNIIMQKRGFQDGDEQKIYSFLKQNKSAQ